MHLLPVKSILQRDGLHFLHISPGTNKKLQVSLIWGTFIKASVNVHVTDWQLGQVTAV